jgi:hypothetical protein
MKKFISLNARSLTMYTFILLIAFGIEISAIFSENPMMYIIPAVLVWMIFAGFMGLFSRCKFTNDELIIFGDFLIEENSKIQKKHIIKLLEVKDYKHETLPSGVDSYFNPIKLSYNQIYQYISMYNYNIIKCITFYLKDGKKECLITNRYSKKQVEEIDSILLEKISKSFDNNIVYNSISSNENERVSIPKIKYPRYITALSVIFALTFGIFAIHSWNLGGDAINGYINGSEHFVSQHGTDTMVTYEEWILNYYFGIAMFISAALFFPSVLIYHMRDWLKKVNSKD